jgi:hypothetical protein
MKFPWSKKVELNEASTATINKNNYKNFIVKAIGFIASQGAYRQDLTPPEYDLEEIRAAAEADSYIKMALMKYSYLMYKAGYELKGNNDKAIEYIKMRFRVMGFATQKPTDILFQEVADDLITYSNAFLVKSRVDKLMPGVNAKGVFADKPIGGYFRVDPDTMLIKRDKNGMVTQYQQRVGFGDKDTKNFAPTDVIHLYLDKNANNAFGTPRLLAALEDVKLLRRVEGNVISLIYRFAIPIYQWAIGLPEPGFQATDQEIKEAQKEIERMPLDGVIVTNEKTNIKAIGAEGQALDASAYLDYFEKRVFTALGLSESQAGRGGAKQDADSMEAQIHDTVKYIQRVMSTFIENYILNELLIEGGFNPIMNEDDIVHYEFNEISLDTKIKLENHEMLKWQSNVVTLAEARSDMGMKADVDENELYFNKVESKLAMEQIGAKNDGAMQIAQIGAAARTATGGGAAGNGKSTKSGKPDGAVKNANRPTNQHGTGSVSVRSSEEEDINLDIKESVETEESRKNPVRTHKKSFDSIYKKYEMLRNDITDTDTDLDLLFPAGHTSIMHEIKIFANMHMHNGMQAAMADISKETGQYYLIPNIHVPIDQFLEEAEDTLKSIMTDIKRRVTLDRSQSNVIATFKGLEYRLRFLLEYILPKIYWYAYVKTGAACGIEKAYIQFKGSDDQGEHESEINTGRFGIDDIPAFHAFCDCKVSFKAGDKKNGNND